MLIPTEPCYRGDGISDGGDDTVVTKCTSAIYVTSENVNIQELTHTLDISLKCINGLLGSV